MGYVWAKEEICLETALCFFTTKHAKKARRSRRDFGRVSVFRFLMAEMLKQVSHERLNFSSVFLILFPAKILIINILCRSFFGYERLSSFGGVREFRCAPVDQKRTKKIKAPIPQHKKICLSPVRWASFFVDMLQTSCLFLWEFVGSSLRSSAPNSLNFLFCF